MNSFKKNLSILLIWLILALIIISISSILVYFNVIKVGEKSFYLYFCSILLFLILGFLSGNIKQKKGLVNGIMYSIFVIIILMLIQILGFEEKLSLNLTAKYVVLILSSGLGGIFGVNFKPVIK